MKTYVLDTHTIVWYLAKDARLSPQARAILQDSAARLIVPSIVLAEIKHLAYKGRFQPGLQEVLDAIDSDPRYMISPIDIRVVQNSPPGLSIHDSLIVGTAVALAGSVDGIVTRDEAIAASGLVPVVW